jgi:hypothetical protein
MRAFSCCLALVLLLPQCGGGTTTGAEPKSAADDAKGSSDSSDGSSKNDSDEDESASETVAAPEKSKGPSCDDGTCSKCGSGICPAGWYCDEKANGGGACSWLTECADKPTCACVTRVLGASCKCHEDNGALKVACD